MTVAAALATPEGSPSPGPSVTVDPSGASLTVSDNVNCRAGAGVNFERLTVVPEGSSVPILARSEGTNWWLVDPPDATSACWVSGDYGTTSGNVGGIPAATAAPSTSSGAPARPSNFNYSYGCVGSAPQTVTTVITWTDSANNETGYRLYRYGVLIAELPANSTQYVDTTEIAAGDGITYGIEAFNDSGASSQRTFTFTC